MKIEGIAARNFQCWEGLDLAFTKPVTLLLGHNNVGKTSIARAVRLLLGDETVTNKSTVTIGSLIRRGADSAQVAGGIRRAGADKPVEVKRTIGPRGLTTSVNGSSVSKDVSDFFAPAGLADAAACFAVIANVSGFLDMAPEKQKAVLLGLVDRSVSAEALEGLPKGYTITPQSFDEVEAAYAEVYKKRTQANAVLDSLIVPVLPEKMPNVDAIKTKLAGLRDEERALITEIGESTGALKAQVARANADRAAVERDIQAAEGEVRGLGSLDEAKNARAKARAHLDAITADRAAVAPQRTRLTLIKGWTEALGKVDAKCVISDEVACPLKTADKGKTILAWKREAESLGDKVGGAPSKAEVDAAQAALDAATQAVETIEEATAGLVNLHEILARMPNATPAPTEHPKAEALVTLQARIKTGEAHLETALGLVKDADTAVKVASQKVEQALKVAELDALCAAYGPKGIRERLLLARLDGLRGGINEALRGFGLTIAFGSEPWAITVNDLPVSLASASERFRLGIAFQIALAQVTGFKFVLVDAVDILDRANRAAMFGLLEDALAQGHIEQAIVTATMTNEAALTAKYPTWLQVVHINGRGSLAPPVAA